MIKNSLTENRDNLATGEAGTTLMQIIAENLDLTRWKFQPTFKNFVTAGNLEVIYDSEWCRIKFKYSRERPDLSQYDELYIYYGRLHAPNSDYFMVWQEQRCWCWHDILDSLRFLDGLSPTDAVQQEKKYGPLPLVVNGFWESELGVSLREVFPPQFSLVNQAVLWEHYGKRLFELFDLRRPDLWQQFRQFNKEFHRLKGTKSYFDHPPRESICG